MNLKDINSRLTEIKTEIGTIRVNRNRNAISTGLWTLAGSLNAVTIVMGDTTI